MALLNRIGNVLKRATSKHINSGLSAFSPSLYQAIRCMSSSKLFVGGISYATDEMSFREAFSQYGEVIDARIIMDRETGRSRGFGFITYTSNEEAASAIEAMNGQDLQGRRVRVNYATERPRGVGFGGGNFYNSGASGGYGGNSYGGGGNSYGGGGSYGNEGSGSYDGGYGVGNTGNYNVGEHGGGYGGNAGNYNVGGSSDNYFPNGSVTGSDTTSTEYGGNTGASYAGGEEQLSGNAGRNDGGNEGFGEDALEGSYGDDNDEPDDYANTKG